MLAGLGVFGRDNLLVTQEYGPRVRLRGIFMDADLEPTAPIEGFDPVRDVQPSRARRRVPRTAFRSGRYRAGALQAGAGPARRRLRGPRRRADGHRRAGPGHQVLPPVRAGLPRRAGRSGGVVARAGEAIPPPTSRASCSTTRAGRPSASSSRASRRRSPRSPPRPRPRAPSRAARRRSGPGRSRRRRRRRLRLRRRRRSTRSSRERALADQRAGKTHVAARDARAARLLRAQGGDRQPAGHGEQCQPPARRRSTSR